MNTKGNVTIAMVTGIFGLIASVAVPIVWITSLKEVNAVQDNKISNVEKNYSELNDRLGGVNDKLDALLLKQGINPALVGGSSYINK